MSAVSVPAAGLAAKPRRKRRFNLAGLTFTVALLCLWQVLTMLQGASKRATPEPTQIVRAAWTELTSGPMLSDAAHTLWVTLVGWVAGVVIGLAIGCWMGLWGRVWRYSIASVEVLRAIPPIAFVPLLLLLLGFSVKAELALAGYAALFPVLIFTIAGIHQYGGTHAEVSTVMRLPYHAEVRKLVLPAAAPSILVGLRLAMAFSLGLTIVSEMIGNPQGVGYRIIFEQNALKLPAMFAYVLLTGLLGWLLNGLLVMGGRLAFPRLLDDARGGGR